jgi:inorganic phosphate transporter, PiT family
VGVVLTALIALAAILGIFLFSRRAGIPSPNLDTVDSGDLVRPKRRKRKASV